MRTTHARRTMSASLKAARKHSHATPAQVAALRLVLLRLTEEGADGHSMDEAAKTCRWLLRSFKHR